MREKDIERILIREVRKRNGLALKFISLGVNGVPDRLVLLQDGRMAFIELKVPGGKMRPIQIKRKKQLEALGFLVYCIDRKEEIEGVIDEIEKSKL